MDLGCINKSIRLEFCLIINTAKDIQPYGGGKKYPETINKFMYGGNQYISIRTSPYIMIHIVTSKKDKSEGWTSNNYISLNQRARFDLLRNLKAFLLKFRDVKELFHYTDNHKRLVVNPLLKNQCSFTMTNGWNKALRMEPTVVIIDNNNEEMYYEGVLFCINGYENFAYMTYLEAEYLYERLREIDMTNLSVNLLNLVKDDIGKETNDEEIKVYHSKPITMETEVEKSSGSLIKFKDNDVIPEI